MAQGLLGGVLPAIYSGADQLKRGVYGLLTNPMEQAERAAQSLLQSRAERQALMGQAFANPDRPFQVTNQAALGQLGSDVLTGELGIAPIGMIAYHGTPHNILGKFDINKVGTGEGNQTFGYGMYFAENPNVAKQYQASLSETKYFADGKQLKGNDAWAAQFLHDFQDDALPKKVDVNTAVAKANEILKSGEAREQIVNKIKQLDKTGVSVESGNLYKVDIPDASIPNMLDWDKPLSQQPDIAQKVKNIGDDYLSKIGILPDLTRRSTGKELTGSELYDALTTYNSQKGASNILANQGITGIRYLDQGSRGTTGGQIIDVFKDSDGWKSKIKVENRSGIGFTSPTDAITTSMPFKTESEAKKWAEEKIQQGTSNFVVFDPTDVKMLERNDKPIEGLLD